MRLAKFITVHLEEIMVEWEAFAASLLAPGERMTSLALRDHASQILQAIAEDIETDQTDLEQAYKSKGFASIAPATRSAAMTHGALRHLAGFDLRTPLSAIANSSLFLGSPGLLPAGQPLEAVRRINRGAARMNSMIRDLLEYTRSRLGRAIPISPEPTSMAQICRIAYDEARAAHPERIFRLDTAEELEGYFDADRLHQVISNLLSNAVQHGARNQPITLRAYGEADRVTVQVKNHGHPIPADQLQVIFNPLVQIPSPVVDEDSTLATSLGLGLYIAREIVTLHGGTLAAESSEHEGTVFSARLPRNPPPPSRCPRSALRVAHCA